MGGRGGEGKGQLLSHTNSSASMRAVGTLLLQPNSNSTTDFEKTCKGGGCFEGFQGCCRTMSVDSVSVLISVMFLSGKCVHMVKRTV